MSGRKCLYSLPLQCVLDLYNVFNDSNNALCFVALFYYTLANIHPKHRSSLKTIQLIAVVCYPLLKEYGFEAVLKPFINEMNELRQVTYSILFVNKHINVL